MKGIGIILVVLGHAIQKNDIDYQNNLLCNLIYSFHMPLFFLVSGYLVYKNINSSHFKWIKNKAFYLLIPHIIFNLIYYFASATDIPNFENFPANYSFIQYVKESLLINTGEWFLWSLFTIFLFMLLIDFVNSRVNNILFVAFTISLVLALWSIPDLGKDYLRIYQLQWFLPFSIVGYFLAKYKDVFQKYIIAIFLLGLVGYPLIMCLSYFRGEWGIVQTQYFLYYLSDGNITPYLLYVQAFCGISLVFIASLLVVKQQFLAKSISWLGSITLGVYLFSSLFSGLRVGSGWMTIIFAFIFSLILGIFFTLLCKKVKILKILLGDVSLKNDATTIPSTHNN